MTFKRKIDENYPCVYDTWKTNDVTWIIQDLPPEDEDEAIKVLVDYLCTDEVLCSYQKLSEDPVSVKEIIQFWRDCLSYRMSLACYHVKDGVRTLAGLNVCLVGEEGEKHKNEFKGEKWYNVFEVIRIIEEQVDPYKYLGLDKLLHAMGLVVRRQFRGNKLGERILAARKPLSLAQGIKGTATVFTGIASQRPAEKCGFVTISQFSMKQLADMGLPYPPDENMIVKYMVKKFV